MTDDMPETIYRPPPQLDFTCMRLNSDIVHINANTSEASSGLLKSIMLNVPDGCCNGYENLQPQLVTMAVKTLVDGSYRS